ncbi:SARP family transcriptional regulator [Acrocarpospora pleiomorpha]|uniref:SARP family transcriptional regulator n=1 Tax=Acrocarpospora pleiomorpha TaxID=90975 RepID=A0A5M3XQT3_9ACTN|nr:BTAD domain-containing putative transcriptional regulator [Acrocarpospora pleiomorpha]GES23146.1 SARP family transcriptional regulator [Acrocarpospora pleiomorpha]
MEFRVLGPVEVLDGARSLQLGGPKPRTLLAALLLESGRVVSVDRLIDILWPLSPPGSAPALIQTYVSALRKELLAAGRGEVIETRAPGYVVRTRPGELDSEQFEALVAEGRRRAAAGDLEGASGSFVAALGLWRGEALGGLGEALRTEATRLEEMRLSAIEERITTDLARNAESEIVAELRSLVGEHPTRERLRGQLMIALYRLGMQAEALTIFQRGRDLLVEELGIEPGPELRAIHEAVLRADDTTLGWTSISRPDSTSRTGTSDQRLRLRDPHLRLPNPRHEVQDLGFGGPDSRAGRAEHPDGRYSGSGEERVEGTRRSGPVLAQLPPEPPDFTGRRHEVEMLAELLVPRVGVPVAVVSGQGGSGKSALAGHVGHRLAREFSDGQIHVELRGMTDAPAAPEEVLGRLLRELGADPVNLPAGQEERAARYRSLLAGRRVLIVLDDAADERQVRPLLPGTPGPAVLITSRNRLAGLAGAAFTELAVLSPDEGVELLTRIVGQDRVGKQEEAARRIVALCGHLPLAIRIAGAKLTSRRAWSLDLMADRLTSELRRLDELAVGDQEVRAGIELSYRALPGPARRGLRLLGLLGLPGFCAATVGALLGLPRDEAEDLIEGLVDAQLVEHTGTDGLGDLRYRIHDLVRIFARERAESEDEPQDRVAAVEGVLGRWLWLIQQITLAAPSGSIHLREAYPHAIEVEPALAESVLADPRAWFEAEQDSLVVGVEVAAAMDLDELAGELASALCGSVFVVHNRLQAWTRTHDAALAAARRAGNKHGEARLLAELGELKFAQDRFAEARECLIQALAMFREVGDAQGETSALASLGASCREQGRFAEALEHLDAARITARAMGEEAAIGQVTRLRGSVRLELGDYSLAQEDLAESLTAYRNAGSRRGEALTLRSLSLVHRAMGELALAEDLAAQSLAIFREVGDELLEAFGVQAWAKSRLRQGKYDGLLTQLENALAVSRRSADRFGTALTLRTLGELHLAEARYDHAATCFDESIHLWDELDLPLFRARTLRDVSHLHTRLGDPTTAHATLQSALQIFDRYGSREYNELTEAPD